MPLQYEKSKKNIPEQKLQKEKFTPNKKKSTAIEPSPEFKKKFGIKK